MKELAAIIMLVCIASGGVAVSHKLHSMSTDSLEKPLRTDAEWEARYGKLKQLQEHHITIVSMSELP